MLKNTMSYKGKKVYIGMDVHKKTYAITAICDDVVVKRFSHVADPIVVSSILRKMFKGAQIFSVYEAGFSGFTLHRELEKVGIHNIVINPASVEVARHDRVKTDKKDSKKLAEHLAMGRLSSVHIPMLKEEAERSLTRTREQLVRNRVRVGNQIKMKLMFHGLLAHNDNRAMSKKFLASVLAMNIDENIRFAIETLVDTWLAISQQILKINKRIKEVLDTKPSISEIYRSVPGVGEISAGVLANELGNLKHRFRNQKAIYCFIQVLLLQNTHQVILPAKVE